MGKFGYFLLLSQKKILFEKFRSKMLNFLTTSNRYNAEKVLVEFPYNDLFEERAIILGRLGKHEKVLAIYIQILGNFDKAIEYCAKTYKPDDAKCVDVYVSLVRTIMKPPKEPPYSDVKLHPRCLTPDIEAVLDILENNAQKINPHTVLQILPDDIPVARLRKFLEIALHHQLEKKRKTQILKGLYYAEHLQVRMTASF
jgi:Vam6/Vps39-like protein vacuolar protein sorting-associated protein 39